jgi:peptidoglycan/LPS O-acetylase OafA/YrhL
MSESALLSPVWSLLIVGTALAIATAILRYSPFFRKEIGTGGGRSLLQLDGLRGYMALAIYMSHAAAFPHWFAAGHWDFAPSTYYVLIGTVSVSMFFMTTGFLFWGKALRSGKHFSVIPLAASRLRRLAPLYLFSMPFFWLLVAHRTGWTLRTDLGSFFESVSQWLALGIGGRPAINGYADTWVINAPTWTLWYEWMFYISLPILTLASGLIGTLVIGFAAIAWCWNTGNEFAVLSLFAGTLAAHFFHRWPDLEFMRGRFAACVALLLVVGIGIGHFERYGVWHTLLLTPLFVVVCYGNDLFGTLSYAPARLIGGISYSIYLAHALLLHASMYWVNAVRPLIEMTGLEFWSVIAGVTIVLVAISTMTFRFVEYPWMKPARRVTGVG